MGFLLALTAVNVSAFVFHLIFSRLLGPGRYSALAAAVGLLSLVSVPLAALEASVTRSAAGLLSAGEEFGIRRLVRRAAIYGAESGLVWCAWAFPMSHYLHQSVIGLLLLGPAIAVAIVVSTVQGATLGLGNFGQVALSQLLGAAIVRLASAALLVELGLGVTGAIAGSVIGSAVSLLVLVAPAGSERRATRQLTVEARAVVHAVLSLGGSAVLISIDPWLARHYLPPVEAGYFSSASTAGRIALFLPSALTLLAFPQLSRSGGRGADARRLFLVTYGTTCLLAFGCAAVLSLAPRFSIGTLFGSAYAPSSSTVIATAFANAAVAVVNVVIYFLLARQDHSARLIWGGCGLTLVLGLLFHGSGTALGLDMLVSDTLLLVAVSATAAAAIAQDQDDRLSGAVTLAGNPLVRLRPAIQWARHRWNRVGPLFVRIACSRRAMIVAPAIAVGAVPLLAWTGPLGHTTAVGGDDSLLYYYDPWKWLVHAPLSTLDNGVSGFNPRVYLAPLPLLLGLLHAVIPLNTQGLAFGILLGATFAGTACLIHILSGGRRSALPAAFLGGTVASAAPLVFQTEAHYLEGIYWRALLPLVVIALGRYLGTGRTRWLVALATLTVAFCGTIMQIPWSLAALPLMVILLVAMKLSGAIAASGRQLVRRLSISAVVVAIVNGFWLVPLGGLLQYPNTQLSGAASSSGRQAATSIVKTLASVQSVPSALGLRLSGAQIAAFHSSPSEAAHWSASLALFGVLPVMLGIGAAIYLFATRRMRMISSLLVVTSIAYLYGENLFASETGASVFAWMTSNIPLFTALRNFYDKFSIPFAASVAIAVGVTVSAVILVSSHKTGIAALSLACAGLFVVYSAPHLAGTEFSQSLPGQSGRTRVMDGLPGDYTAMLEALQAEPPGAVLTLPLASPAWSFIPASTGPGTYMGLSPIFYLTGRSDYDGLDSFASPAMSDLRPQVQTMFASGDVAAIGGLVKLLGVRYVVTDRTNDPAADPDTYDVGFEPSAREAKVTRAVLQHIAPSVVITAGRWQVNRVSGAYARPVIQPLNPSCPGPQTAVAGDRTSMSVVLPASGQECAYDVQEPFTSAWSMTLAGRGLRTTRGFEGLTDVVVPAHRAAELRIVYRPQLLVRYGVVESLLGTALLILIWAGRRKLRGRDRSQLPGEPAPGSTGAGRSD